MAYSNIPTGLKVPSQVPLDGKKFIRYQNELLTLDNKPFEYHDGLTIYCQDTGNEFIWREAKNNEVGLLPANFEYPQSTPIVERVNYRGKFYNFFKIEKLTRADVEDLIPEQTTYTFEDTSTDGFGFKSTTSDNSNFKIRKIKTNNLNIYEENDIIIIDSPVVEGGLKMFYVNENYTGTVEDGSMVRPYKRLITALRDVIGNGTLSDPEIKDVNIRLQSNVGITQGELDTVPALLNKLSVNTLSYSSDGSSNRYFISYEGNTDYPIDFRTLINQVGRDSDGNLLRPIYINFSNIEVRCVNVFGIMYIKDAENNTSNQYKTYCGITNTYFNCEYRPSSYYTELKNIDNTNINFFGSNLKGQNSIPLTTPHVVVEGFDRFTEGTTLGLNNSKIQGSSQVCLKGLNTILSGQLEVSYEGLYQNYELNPNTPNKYLPKSDLNAIEFTDTYFIGSIKDPNAYPYYKGNPFPDLTNKVGGYNSFIKAIRTSNAPVEIPNTISIESWVYSAGSNYFAIINDKVNLNIYNSDLTSHTTVIRAFTTDVDYDNRLQINVHGSLISNVKNESITNIRLRASNATINGFNYSSMPSYIDDAEALSSGLIHGNEYFNSTTNTLHRIEFPV